MMERATALAPTAPAAPRLSVCMATYNGARYLPQQIASILAELGPDDELVVVDDASRDDTLAVLRATVDSRLALHPNPANLGHVRSFGRALALAKGDVLLLSDQDDVWLPGRVARLCEALRRAPSAWLATGNLRHMDTAGRPVDVPWTPLRAIDSTRHLANVAGIFAGRRAYYGCAMALRRQMLEVALPIPGFAESHDLWLGLVANLGRANVHVAEDTLVRRLHGANMTRTDRPLSRKLWSRVFFVRAVCVIAWRLARRAARRPAAAAGRARQGQRSMPSDPAPPSTAIGGSRLRKFVRFASIYGLRKTLLKAFGRSRSLARLLPPSRTAPVRDIGLIGCGQFGFATIGHAITRRFGNRFINCFDIDAEAQQSFARFYRIAPGAASAQAVIDDPAVRVVYVASNHASHTDYAARALAAGKRVYIEKPISVDAAQFRRLIEAQRAPAAPEVFAGYNRPFSRAVRDLAVAAAGATGPLTLNCFVTGHAIPADHWYRRPDEGTRICGNVGHWLDLAVHMLSWSGLPDRWQVGLAWARPEARDEDLTITLASERGDLVVITLTARDEPFEGINETINFQQGSLIAKIDDFRSMTVWQGNRVRKRRYWPKDVGHQLALVQPFSAERRAWREVELSTLLMLFIKERVVAAERLSSFSFSEEWRRLGIDAAPRPSSP